MAVGRRPLALEKPITPLQRFSWAARTARTYSSDGDLRRSATFSSKLASILGSRFAPETINKMERGGLSFDIAKSLGYESLLGLVPWSLADLYIYSARLQGIEPDWSRFVYAVDETPNDLLFALAREEPLTAPQLLSLTKNLISPGNDVLKSRVWRGRICHAVLDAFGDAFEMDERLLREALILLGDKVVPHIVERTESQPLRYFNAIESLGFMTSSASWQALARLGECEVQGVQGQIIVESVRRRLASNGIAANEFGVRLPELFDYCVRAIGDPIHPFTAREESLALLSLTSTNWTHFSEISNLREDIHQLRVQPQSHSKRDLVGEVVLRAEESSAALADQSEMPRSLSGLAALVEEGIYGRHRVDRLAASMILGSVPTANFTCAAVGQVSLQTDAADYGVKRSCVRLITKAGYSEGLGYVSRMAREQMRDEGLRLAVAWALGLANDREDRLSLISIGAEGSPVTRQVAELSWKRRHFGGTPLEPQQLIVE